MELEELRLGMPALTPAWGAALGEASAVCFHTQGHVTGVAMSIQTTPAELCSSWMGVRWQPVTEQMIRNCNDLQEATEFGACGVAILLAKRMTGFTVVERARKRTGFDYWIGNHTDETPFQNMARLEVSGILFGEEPDIRSRINRKIDQTSVSGGEFPVYIIVVEFGTPHSRVLKR